MPRYVVERIFPEGVEISLGEEGVQFCEGVVAKNADDGVPGSTRMSARTTGRRSASTTRRRRRQFARRRHGTAFLSSRSRRCASSTRTSIR